MDVFSNISYKNVTFITCMKNVFFSGVAKLLLSTVYFMLQNMLHILLESIALEFLAFSGNS